MINKELAEHFAEQSRLRKELSRIDAKIGHLSKSLTNETIEETKSSVTPDAAEFGSWLKSRRERLQKIQRNKNKSNKRIINEFPPRITALYSLYHKKEMVYVGVTNDYKRRMQQHKRSDKVFDKSEILQLHKDRFYAMREEHRLREEHNPRYNISKYI